MTPAEGWAGSTPFRDRTHELASLEAWWSERIPQLVTVFGRRQIGKTGLLVRFFQDRPAIYFYADQRPRLEQLEAVRQQVLLVEPDDAPRNYQDLWIGVPCDVGVTS